MGDNPRTVKDWKSIKLGVELEPEKRFRVDLQRTAGDVVVTGIGESPGEAYSDALAKASDVEETIITPWMWRPL